MIKAKFDAFVVSKPIQYLNVLNIENYNSKILLLVNAFYNAESFFNKIHESNNYWEKTIFFYDVPSMFAWLIDNKDKISSLFIDSDINYRKEFYLLRNLNISVYEEGVGTYRKRQYLPRRKIIGNLFLIYLRILGYKNRRGGNKFTKNIIVYFPDFYKKHLNEQTKKVLTFKNDFLTHLYKFSDSNLFKIDFDFILFKNKIILLFISSWEISDSDLEKVNSIKCDFKVLKPHPHLNNTLFLNNFNYCFINFVPAEFLILKISQFASELILVSKYSSSSIYFVNNPKVRVVNLDMAPELHNDLQSYLDAYFGILNYLNNNSL